ncbi:MAG TPA: TetR/AcrR family transcriptional regulator [Solirubrobacteraceae bacterium]|nr:TetR/AcrR family transcriptional regulator [Solirubrobacteraceae bacterium]
MASRATRKQTIRSPSARGRRGTQRERLLAGMVVVASRSGYAGASVAQVIEQANVSRPTFYEYFADRDDCFLHTLADVQAQLLTRVREAVRAGAPQDALRETVGVLVRFASSEPEMAHFLMGVSMAAGPVALDIRDQGIVEIEETIESAHEQAAAQAAVPDVPPRVIVGAVQQLLAARLGRREAGNGALADDLAGWVDSYRHSGRRRWRTLKPAARPQRSPHVPAKPETPPGQLGPGRPAISRDEVAFNHRARILFATASVAREKGFTASTIAEITRLASIDGSAYYSLFEDKRQAFTAAARHTLQRLIAITARAYFCAEDWPERVWQAARAFTQYLEGNPTLAHVALIEPYAIGPGAVEQAQDAQSAIGLLLQEGYQQLPHGQTGPGEIVLAAIIAGVFEIAYLQLRAAGSNSKPRLSGLSGAVAYLCLAPFLGAAQAARALHSRF